MSKVKKPTFHERFGNNVRDMRKRLKLPQRELAADAGISVSFLSDVENGKRCVSLINAVNIAHVLGVPLAYLLPRASTS